MGAHHSQEEACLLTQLQPTQYTILEDTRQWQLWEDRISTRRYRVYTLEEAMLQDHHIQIYHFRKLNRAYLTGVHCLARQDTPSLCARTSRTLLLLQDLPHTLTDYSHALSLNEGLTVLQAALAGYRIMSFLFGPLLCSPETVFFTEAGVPKVWANQQLQLNQPSPSSQEHTTSQQYVRSNAFPQPSVAEKKANSIQSIVSTVSNALSSPFPRQLCGLFEGVRSYEEAEQALELFCRRQGIEIQEWVEAKPISEHERLNAVGSRTFLSKVSSGPIEQPLTQHPIIRSQQTIKHPYYPPLPLPPYNFIPPSTQAPPFSRVNIIIPPPQPLQLTPIMQHAPHPRSMVALQPVITQTIISSFPSDSQQLKAPPLFKTNKVSADDRMPPIPEAKPAQQIQPNITYQRPLQQPPQEQRQHIEQNHLPTRQQILSQQAQSRHSHQSHPEAPPQDLNYQLVVHQISDHSISNLQPPQFDDKTIQMEEVVSQRVSTPPQEGAKADIELWEESMQRVARKMASGHSSDCYRSEERDQVPILEAINHQQHIPTNSNSNPMAEYTSQQDLQQYIRSKYSEYFKQQPSIKPIHHHTSSLDKQLFEKRVCFSLPEEQQEEQPIQTSKFVVKPPSLHSFKKYTFGLIEQPSEGAATVPDEGRRRKRDEQDSINARYSKYVTNRSGKPPKQPTSHFSKERTDSSGYDQLRRLLKQ